MGLAELISGGESAADAPELGVSEGEAAPATPPKAEELGVEGDDTGKPKAIPYATARFRSTIGDGIIVASSS